MNQQMKILKEIAIISDRFGKKARELGECAAKAFGKKHKAQMKNLENIAYSASKVSDVLNYIKRQTGKAKEHEQWKKNNFGSKLLKWIEKNLKKDKDIVIEKLSIISYETELEIYLRLIQEFIKQMVIHYEYEIGD